MCQRCRPFCNCHKAAVKTTCTMRLPQALYYAHIALHYAQRRTGWTKKTHQNWSEVRKHQGDWRRPINKCHHSFDKSANLIPVVLLALIADTSSNRFSNKHMADGSRRQPTTHERCWWLSHYESILPVEILISPPSGILINFMRRKGSKCKWAQLVSQLN